MSKVTFRSKQAYLQISHETLFHVGDDAVRFANLFDGKMRWIGTQEQYEKLQSLPDPDHAGGSYIFLGGADHNELTVEREDVIQAMRAYIEARHDDLIVEVQEA
ncbi:MAG: hypothetical protein KHY46_12365 [Clostridiales bacterium]|nr:hypothetical protein [Clostridiales bacterium]